MNSNIVLSIVIPCRNEEKHIVKCLESIISSDFPANLIEVLVVDGRSSDETRELVRHISERYAFILLVDNEKKTTPRALNLGIQQARGKYVLILSSHSVVDRSFIKENIRTMESYDTDCVGGRLITLASGETLVALAIAKAMAHPFGVGNAYFRIGSMGARYVDTVPFGCYKREIFDRIGLFDEDLIRNQDDEFNFRVISKGGKVFLNPNIVSYYYARDTLSKLSRMFYQYGYFKPLVAQKIGKIVTWRQLIPALFVLGIILLCGLAIVDQSLRWPILSLVTIYSAINLVTSFLIARSEKRLFAALPAVFLTVHVSYGFGYLKGILDFLLLKRHMGKRLSDVKLSR